MFFSSYLCSKLVIPRYKKERKKSGLFRDKDKHEKYIKYWICIPWVLKGKKKKNQFPEILALYETLLPLYKIPELFN